MIESEQSYRVLSDTRTAWLQQLSQEPDLWQWCVRQDQETLLRLLAYCVATSVNAVQTKADSDRNIRLQHADRLATTLGVNMTKWFTPDLNNFFGRITKPQMVEAMKEAGHTPDSASLSLKKAQLASIAAVLCATQVGYRNLSVSMLFRRRSPWTRTSRPQPSAAAGQETVSPCHAGLPSGASQLAYGPETGLELHSYKRGAPQVGNWRRM